MTPWTDLDGATTYAGNILNGERIRLRAPREDDFSTLAGWWCDPVVAILNNASVVPESQADAAEKFRTWSKPSLGGAAFSVEQIADGALAGHITLFGATTKDRCATMAVMMGPPFWGRGIGTEALGLVVDFAFRELGLHRVQLAVFSFNARAVAAYTRLGFVEEGRSRESLFHDGGWHDDVRMGLLDREWAARRTP